MKKFLLISLSVFLVCLIMPVKELCADPDPSGTTYYSDDLSEGDLILAGDKIQHDASCSQQVSITFDESVDGTLYDTYTADNNYTITRIWTLAMSSILEYVLSPAVEIKFYVNGAADPAVTKIAGLYNGLKVSGTNVTEIDYDDNESSISVPLPAGDNVYWTWTTDRYSTPQNFPSYDGASNKLLFDNIFNSVYELKVNATIYTSELTSFDVVGDVSIGVGDSASYVINVIDQNGSYMQGNQGTITVQQVDSSGTAIAGIDPISITYNDGYSFNVSAEGMSPGTIYYKVSSGDKNKIFSILIEDTGADNGLSNNAWPYGTTFSAASVTLNTGVNMATDSVSYQWQESNNGNIEANYSDISAATANTYVAAPSNDKWYRCKVTYTPTGGTETTAYTKGVQIIKDSNISLSFENKPNGIEMCYVSNGKGAYTFNKSQGKFNILGLWNDKWVNTSYDPYWSIYMKQPGTEGEDTVPVALSNINTICARFRDYNTSYVLFDVKFNNACDAALYTDVCLGDTSLFDYCDTAAVKANLNSDKTLSSIQMFANKDFETANGNTCSFVLKPILESVFDGSTLPTNSTFTIDSYDNTDSDIYWNEWDCTVTSGYDAEDWYDYDDEVIYCEPGFFHNANTIREDFIDAYGDNWNQYFRYDGDVDAYVGLYNNDSVLAMSWSNVTEISYMFGIGKANSLSEYITFNDIPAPSGNNGGGGSGSSWIEIPNTFAYTR